MTDVDRSGQMNRQVRSSKKWQVAQNLKILLIMKVNRRTLEMMVVDVREYLCALENHLT